MDELRALTAAQIAAGVNEGALDPVEVAETHLRGIDEIGKLNAVLATCPERALEQAKAPVRGPLAGVPLLVKDLFDTEGVRTTYGSSIFAEHVPERTATAVARLEAAGAIVIGKANLHEFAWGTTSQNPHFGYVHNPVRPGKVAGGSSGGNAAALAAGVSALGIGSDTGGSVRLPSGCCDTVGFKPSYGKVSAEGCFPLSASFDHVGPMARTVSDCALAYSVLSGEPTPEPRIDCLVVGVLEQAPKASPHEPHGDGRRFQDERVPGWARQLEALGCRIVEAVLPEPEAEVVPLFVFEAAVAHRGLFPERREEYGPDTKLKWDAARRVPAIDVYEAERELPRWRERASREPAVDLLLCPTLGMEIPPIDVWEPDIRVQMTTYTRCFNFLGWPAIAIGPLQLAGRDDATVLAAALAWEEAYGPPGRAVEESRGRAGG